MSLDSFIVIRNKLFDCKISSNEIEGWINPNSIDIQLLQELAELQYVDQFVETSTGNKSIEDIKEGNKIKLRMYPLQLSEEKFYETVTDLVKFSNQSYPVERFYVFSQKFDSSSPDKPLEILRYENVTKLISFLNSICDYSNDKQLVFFQNRQLSLITEYNVNELVDISDLDITITHVRDSVYSDERKIIFINELIAKLKDEPENLRFGKLISSFGILSKNYKKSHNLYLEKYSYTKFKSELDKEIIEYSKKIQSVINDAQAKLVAIPAAFLLIIGQFDLTGSKFYFNIALIISSFVFAILLEVLISNQYSALEFIKDDVNRFKNSIDDKKVEILAEDFSLVFFKIKGLYDKQKVYLNVIRGLIWLTPFFAIALFALSLSKHPFILLIKNILS